MYGPEKGGKTTTCLKIIASFQAQGLVASFIDAEHTLDLRYAQTLGVNIDDLLYYCPDEESAEYVLEVACMQIASGEVDLLVIDSIAALASEAELKGTMNDRQYCGISQPLTTFCDKVVYSGVLARSECTLIGINQIRDAVGVIYGKKTKTPGGRSWGHACSIKTEITKGDYITRARGSNEERIGQQVNFFVEKNKIRKPFRSGFYNLYFDAGVNPLLDVISMAKEFRDQIDGIRWAGSYLYYTMNDQEVMIGQGNNNQMVFLAQNPEVYSSLKTKILDCIRSGI